MKRVGTLASGIWLTIWYAFCSVLGLFILFALIFSLNEYIIIPGVLLLAAGCFTCSRVFALFRNRRLASGIVEHVHIPQEGPTTYSIGFTAGLHGYVTSKATFGGEIGSKVLLLYDAEQPTSDIRKCSFASIWLTTILLTWSGGACLIAGICQLLSR